MQCRTCGNDLAEEPTFCPRCGTRLTLEAGWDETRQAPPEPRERAWQPIPPAVEVPSVAGAYHIPIEERQRRRVLAHAEPLGLVWCVWGVCRLLLGLARAGGAHHSWLWMFGLGLPLHLFALLMASLAVVAGYGLLARTPWARRLALVLGVVTLFHPLLGTALGVYTLWTLLPRVAGPELRRLGPRTAF